MRFHLLLLLSALAAPTSLPARAQMPPQGDGFTWERIPGQPLLSPNAIAFDTAGRLWVGSNGIWVRQIDGTWENVSPTLTAGADSFLPLEGDTLFTSRNRIWRTTDVGQTWEEVHDGGGEGITELSPTLFFSGDHFRSTDRGDTWEPFIFKTGSVAGDRANAAVVLAPGRIGAGVYNGVVVSEDSAQTFYPTSLYQELRYVIEKMVRIKRPDGGWRVLSFGYDQTRPHTRAWASDDGGRTWNDGVPLPQTRPPGIGGGAQGVIPLGGSSALVVLGRGDIYRTDDTGSTWDVVGAVTPVDSNIVAVQDAILGPDSRLYVALRQAGPNWELSGVFRTTLPVTAAEPDAPVAASPALLRLTVHPNPTAGAATVTLDVQTAGPVHAEVFDARGRRVALLADRTFLPGHHRLRFDGRGLSAGVYTVRAVADGYSVSRRVTLVR